MSDRETVLIRGAGLVGIAWGLLLLYRGPQVWSRVNHQPPAEIDEVAIRLLGARHLAQGAVETVAPAHLQRLFILVDLTHMATMVALGVADPGRRRPAMVTAAVAVASATTTWAGRASR